MYILCTCLKVLYMAMSWMQQVRRHTCDWRARYMYSWSQKLKQIGRPSFPSMTGMAKRASPMACGVRSPTVRVDLTVSIWRECNWPDLENGHLNFWCVSGWGYLFMWNSPHSSSSESSPSRLFELRWVWFLNDNHFQSNRSSMFFVSGVIRWCSS